jgi:hypothetical protein
MRINSQMVEDLLDTEECLRFMERAKSFVSQVICLFVRMRQ